MQQAQDDLAAALTSYQASLAIAEHLAKADPGNAGWPAKGRTAPNMTDFDEDSDQPVQQHLTEYFRAAARFRTLEAEVTTPRVKQHLRALIDEYEKLARRAKEPAASLR